MPLGGMLINRVKRDAENPSVVLKTREGVRSAGMQKQLIRSADANVGKQEKLKLYREPNEDYTNNLERIREYKQRALMQAYGVHESETPQKEREVRSNRLDRLLLQQSGQKCLLPSISSTKASDYTSDSTKQHALIR